MLEIREMKDMQGSVCDVCQIRERYDKIERGWILPLFIYRVITVFLPSNLVAIPTKSQPSQSNSGNSAPTACGFSQFDTELATEMVYHGKPSKGCGNCR
jgi:hypothetical protein